MTEDPKREGAIATVYDPERPEPLQHELEEVARDERRFLVRVYGVASLALAISALVAYWALHRPEMFDYVREHRTSFQVLFVFEVISVAVISRIVDKMTLGLAWLTLVGYAIFNGMSFCVFFLVVPPGSVAFGFLVSALTFAAMSAYGLYFPERELRGIGFMFKSLLMGLAIVVATNLLAGNSIAYWATSYLGVMIFASLASYHVDFICDLQYEFEDDDRAHDKASVAGALVIYLDFVNFYFLVMRMLSIALSKADEKN